MLVIPAPQSEFWKIWVSNTAQIVACLGERWNGRHCCPSGSNTNSNTCSDPKSGCCSDGNYSLCSNKCEAECHKKLGCFTYLHKQEHLLLPWLYSLRQRTKLGAIKLWASTFGFQFNSGNMFSRHRRCAGQHRWNLYSSQNQHFS